MMEKKETSENIILFGAIDLFRLDLKLSSIKMNDHSQNRQSLMMRKLIGYTKKRRKHICMSKHSIWFFISFMFYAYD